MVSHCNPRGKIKNDFFNMCFLQIAEEMGKSETEVTSMLCVSNNDIFNAIQLLDLGGHEYIEYYIEELTKEVCCC